MKQFCFWDEDDLDNLPADFKLVPFKVDYIDPDINEIPRTLTSEKSPQEQKPSISVRPG